MPDAVLSGEQTSHKEALRTSFDQLGLNTLEHLTKPAPQLNLPADACQCDWLANVESSQERPHAVTYPQHQVGLVQS